LKLTTRQLRSLIKEVLDEAAYTGDEFSELYDQLVDVLGKLKKNHDMDPMKVAAQAAKHL